MEPGVSRREDVDNVIWQDADFDALSNEAQLLYLWSFTNPRCGMAGIYQVPRRQLLEGRLDSVALDAALDELAAARFAVYEDGVLWVRTRVKHLRTQSPQIAKSIATDLDKVPANHPLLAAFVEENRGGWLDPFGTLDRPSQLRSVEPDQKGSGEGHSTLQGKGTLKTEGLGKGKGVVARARDAGFDDWLADHQEVTAHRPPGKATKAYATIAGQYLACLADYSLEDLKLASRGAHLDRNRRENGWDTADSVLRVTKVHKLVEAGRRGSVGVVGQSSPGMENAKRLAREAGVAA